MPYHDPDPDDPQLLVGVELPGSEATTREMAAAFAEEFARLGWSRARILALFHQPFYAAAHQALRLLGAAEIARLVDESVALWGRCTVVVEDAPEEAAEAGARAGEHRLVRTDGSLKVLRQGD